uniref:Uncharacterized protein n=1 Tax=viral metagenome TaxID=1070528 RepID=A0A6C0AEC3_9ZZZZ
MSELLKLKIEKEKVKQIYHVRRDWQILNKKSKFPESEDLKLFFINTFLNFDLLSNIILDNKNQEEAELFFVEKIIKKMFSIADEYILNILDKKEKIINNEFGINIHLEEIGRKFWYASMQTKIPTEIEKLNYNDILVIFDNNNLIYVYENIDKEYKNLFLDLMKNILTLYSYIYLSDPRCYLIPNPETEVLFDSHKHEEILSPGIKRFGRIKDGQPVQIVIPGLYFENDINSNPVNKALVRRYK